MDRHRAEAGDDASVMSLETDTAVPIVVLPMVISRRPGTGRRCSRSGPQDRADAALIVAEDVDEEQQHMIGVSSRFRVRDG